MRLPDDVGNPNLCRDFVAALPIDLVAISTLGPPFELETVCSSDPLAARLDQLQLDYGEGPCWQARASRAPVLLNDLRAPLAVPWPVVHEAITALKIRGAYAFPMFVGALSIGAVDLYSAAPDALSPANVTTAAAMAGMAARAILRRALAHRDDVFVDDPSSRRIVHQATGMVVAQLRIPADDALLVLRAHAFAASESLAVIAGEVVARRLDFSA